MAAALIALDARVWQCADWLFNICLWERDGNPVEPDIGMCIHVQNVRRGCKDHCGYCCIFDGAEGDRENDRECRLHLPGCFL